MILPVILLVALALGRGRLGSAQLIRDEFDATVFPVAAVSRAREHGLNGRLYHEFAWGGYLLYAWPSQRIYIDGGTDFFGEDLFREYSLIKGMAPGWRDRLSAHGISLLLLRRDSPVSHQVARDGIWSMWYCDSLAVVFRRAEAAQPTLRNADAAEQELNACAERASTAFRHRDE